MARERRRPEEGEARVEGAEVRGDEEEIRDEDFQFALKELLAAYEPLLSEDLERARAPEELQKEALEHPPTCEDELQLAERIFDRFFTEEVAQRLLPAEGREQLGPIEQWQWCIRHIRCCIIFGWLVCRGPRTFRAFGYYLFRYWLCVRRALGDAPIERPLNDAEREDFASLLRALAGAYKPYLTDQLATVEFPLGLPDEIIGGKIDCQEGEEEAAAVFERLLSVDVAPALLGRKAFEEHRNDPSFWFCRCWCLCAIRFGCCLARARTLLDVLRCLRFYRRCLRECFQPLRCVITAPTECAVEQYGLLPSVSPIATALQIEGAATGSSPVVGGVLGWLDTSLLASDTYEIRVCVYSQQTGRTCCCSQFTLFKRQVWIDGVTNIPAPVSMATPPGPYDSTAPVVNVTPGGTVVPVGGPITVTGTAWVGDCQDRKIKCVDLRAAVGWLPGPDDPGFGATLPQYTIPMLPAPICYDDVDEKLKRAWWNRLAGYHVHLTRYWHK